MKTLSVSPIFHVANLQSAIGFYCDVMGFTRIFVYGNPPYYAGVKLGEITLHLSSSKDGGLPCGGGSAYVFCEEIDAYYELIRARGAKVTSALATWPYGIRDFQIKDIDGNRVCFGCSTPVA